MHRKSRKEMIAWDGEGINLSGKHKPQHYVLFGCSANVESPLVVTDSTQNLSFEEIAEYALDIARDNPNCWHIGYFFGYDQNMIIRSLHWAIKERIHDKGRARVTGSNGMNYRIRYIPEKSITITRESPRQTICIEDMGSFFASSFMSAYEKLFPEKIGTPEYEIIKAGKAARGGESYSDMPKVVRYWQSEIVALKELAEKFRDLMWDSGFELKKWSGPGAFANHLRHQFRLIEHEWGGKEENLSMAVHNAVKSGFYGGRFEQFQIGRIDQKCWGIDRNSAYPDGFRFIPSMKRGGHWVQVSKPSHDNVFGIYHVLFRASEAGPITLPSPNRGKDRVIVPRCYKPMPFPFRTPKGNVTFPCAVDGWYYTPEVVSATKAFGDEVQIIDGWEWLPAEINEYPWRDVFEVMFTKRLELKGPPYNPLEMVFKLGPNSFFGKMAQRLGWKDLGKAPLSHTLCIAGYITSYTRAKMYDVLVQIPQEELIAVETDGIYTTHDPEDLILPDGLGTGLGQWGIDEYTEIKYIQNGFYIARGIDKKGNNSWHKPKTRGFSPDNISPSKLDIYLKSLEANAEWDKFPLYTGQRFTSLGASIARSRTKDGEINPIKADLLHCTWFDDERKINPNGGGKRLHSYRFCPVCAEGHKAYDKAHPLFINEPIISKSEIDHKGYPISKPHALPWEACYVMPEWEQLNEELGVASELLYSMEDV